MIITMASFKGGVGKSTSAVHLAAHLAQSAKTLLVDGDPNRSVTRWASEGKLPFTVVSEAQAAMHARHYEHIVIDTKARPDPEDLREIATGCHLLVLPCTPDPLSVDALLATVKPGITRVVDGSADCGTQAPSVPLLSQTEAAT